MNDDFKNKIVSIINAALGIHINCPQITAEDVSFFIPVFSRQSVLPILASGLKNIGRTDLLTVDLIKHEAKAVYDYIQRKTSLDEIMEAFDSASILYVPLKGSSICDLYPEPEMRTSNDIDVLIHAKDLNKSIKLLEEKTTFKYINKEQHDAHFINKSVHLELHYSLLSGIDSLDCALLEPWVYTNKITDSFRCHFTNEFNLFYITAHAAKHFIRDGGIGIRPILDIFVIKTKTKCDDDLVKQYCEKSGISGFYDMCIKLIDVWFHGDSHDDNSKLFEDLVISGGVYGSEHLRIVSNKRKDAGKKYIFGRIFKSSEELRNYYPNCRKYPLLVPYYQVVRWISMLKSRTTNDYVSELKQANSIDQAEVEKYDKLMKSMGM